MKRTKLSNFKGFAELRVPGDLVKKLEHDFDRILQSPEDEYAAFDFFVTAEHLLDWMYPADPTTKRALRAGSALLRITSHLANGVKHFETKDTRHRSVDSVRKRSGYAAAGYVATGYFVDGSLDVHLTPDEQISFGQSTISVVDLARIVLQYWKAHSLQT